MYYRISPHVLNPPPTPTVILLAPSVHAILLS